MTRPLFQLAVTLGISLMCTQGSAAQSSGLARKKWVAASTTAMSITGDIKISVNNLSMVGRDYPLTLIRDIDTEHLIDAGRIVDETKPADARIYRIKIPARVKLLNGNTLCGPKSANWMLTVTPNAHSLSLAFFSGDSEPNLATASESTELCGTFGYFR